jgi:hypothetical protein
MVLYFLICGLAITSFWLGLLVGKTMGKQDSNAISDEIINDLREQVIEARNN